MKTMIDDTMFKECYREAEQGNAEAQFNLGRMYATGQTFIRRSMCSRRVGSRLAYRAQAPGLTPICFAIKAISLGSGSMFAQSSWPG